MEYDMEYHVKYNMHIYIWTNVYIHLRDIIHMCVYIYIDVARWKCITMWGTPFVTLGRGVLGILIHVDVIIPTNGAIYMMLYVHVVVCSCWDTVKACWGNVLLLPGWEFEVWFGYLCWWFQVRGQNLNSFPLKWKVLFHEWKQLPVGSWRVSMAQQHQLAIIEVMEMPKKRRRRMKPWRRRTSLELHRGGHFLALGCERWGTNGKLGEEVGQSNVLHASSCRLLKSE